MTYIDVFDVEEKDLINHLTAGENVFKITKKDLIEHIQFCVEINEGENADKDILALCEGLHTKVSNITLEEWDRIKAFLPFDLAYSESDQLPIDEVEEVI